MRLRFIGIIVSLFFTFSSQASHIIGGEITYSCLGNGEYIVELRVYRDCAPGNAEFQLGMDDAITYFKCGADGSCPGLMQSDGINATRPNTEFNFVEPPELECLVGPDNICVEQATYRYGDSANRRLNLNITTDTTYVFVYQRCCRNSTVQNILDPLRTGTSFVAKISPASQNACNSSPTFRQFPPTLICNNEPLNFDHSAIDPDGDSLVYSFCNVIVGGGIDGDPSFENADLSNISCTGASPNPACPNIDESVQYVTPTYSAEAPMAGNPVVTIDPQTGIISGTPNILGQFVVGVCVEEYRNGQLLGSIQRDFQFNVLPCEKEVTAQIASDRTEFETDADGQIIARNFISTFCGTGAVNFVNQSFDRASIDSISWIFPEGNIISDDWDALVEFPGRGEFEGRLILNPNSQVCADSANIFVEILPELRAGFSAEVDSCEITPVQFRDTSFTEDSNIINWQWDFDDGNSSALANPNHQYDNAGSFTVELTVTDDNGCEESTTRIIEYAPAPQSVAIAQSATNGCHPTPIVFTNNSTPLNQDFNVLWDFGDGNTSTEISPIHVYELPGVYSVSLSIESPLGCEAADNFPNLITILESPSAGFTFTPAELTTTNPTIMVTDASLNATNWLYQFSNQGTSTSPSPSFTFRDTGQQQIVQIVTAPSGCRDTTVQFVDIIPFVEWHMPNAFTPNRDGVNDIFIGNGNLLGAENFVFTIWNRWGELIFETNDFTQGWNGQKNNTGRDSPLGVYIYVVSYRTPRGDLVQLEGFATLVR